jgi:chromosome partitioning protein
MHSDLPNNEDETHASNQEASAPESVDHGELSVEEWAELERATDPDWSPDGDDDPHGPGWIEAAKKAETLIESNFSMSNIDEPPPDLEGKAENVILQSNMPEESGASDETPAEVVAAAHDVDTVAEWDPVEPETVAGLGANTEPVDATRQDASTMQGTQQVVELADENDDSEKRDEADTKLSMPLPRIIAVANQKGGVGKTTTTVNVAACLAEQGYRTLLVDLDPQANASTGLGLNPRELESSIYHVMLHDEDADSCIEPTEVKNLFILPSSLDLAGAEIELVSLLSREHRLRLAIESVIDDYDYVLIDCPPSLGLLTINALTAAHEVLVPIQCEYYALEGLGQLMRNVDLIRASLNPDLQISHIVLVMFDPRTKLAGQVVDEVRSHFGSTVCDNVIPRTVRLSEAPSFGQPITTFDSDSRGAAAYRAVTQEVLNGQA